MVEMLKVVNVIPQVDSIAVSTIVNMVSARYIYIYINMQLTVVRDRTISSNDGYYKTAIPKYSRKGCVRDVGKLKFGSTRLTQGLESASGCRSVSIGLRCSIVALTRRLRARPSKFQRRQSRRRDQVAM
jgi:hypothetical protein